MTRARASVALALLVGCRAPATGGGDGGGDAAPRTDTATDTRPLVTSDLGPPRPDAARISAAPADATGISAAPADAAQAPAPRPYGSGLSEPFRHPDPPRGRTINVVDHGATPGNPSDDDGLAFARALAAAAPGDEVFVPNGTYQIKTRRSIKVPTGVSLRGQSRDGVILDALFTRVEGNVGSYLVEVPAGAGNTILSSFTITCSGGDPLRYAVWIGFESGPPATRVEVKDLLVTRFEKMGISVRGGKHVHIHDNVIRDATAVGGGGEGYGVMLGYPTSSNNLVARNKLLGPNLRHGVLLQYGTSHNLVEHNEAVATTMDSYDLHGEDEHSNELRFNSAVNCGEGGFGVGNTGGKPEHFDAGPHNWIHHNVVDGCRYGIHIYRESHRQYVEDNTFINNRTLGIAIINEGANSCRLLRNKVQKNAAGCRFENARDLYMEANVVTMNTGYGMKLLSTSPGYTIIGNDFRNNGGRVERAAAGRYEGNQE